MTMLLNDICQSGCWCNANIIHFQANGMHSTAVNNRFNA